jgi:hypothetical protein
MHDGDDYGVQPITNWRLRELLKIEREAQAHARLSADLFHALRDLLAVIAADDLVPESVSYMQQARAAIAKIEGQ